MGAMGGWTGRAAGRREAGLWPGYPRLHQWGRYEVLDPSAHYRHATGPGLMRTWATGPAGTLDTNCD